MPILRSTFAAALVAVLAAGAPATVDAQRASLAERVARLEQALQSGGGEEQRETLTELVYELDALRSEVRELRGLIEEQRFALENLRGSQQDQYLDLDRRLSQLAVAPAQRPRQDFPAPGAGAGDEARAARRLGEPARDTRAPASDDRTPPAGALPEVREPVDAALETRGLGEADDAPVVAMADPAAEKAAYDEAFEALRNGRYAEASRQFAAFVDQYPGSEYADNAQYWLGESYYVTRNYRVALEAFQRLLSGFPDSAKRPDAQLKIGLSYYSLQNWEAAEGELRAVIENYPDTTVSRLAQNRLRTMRIEGYID